MPAEQNVADAIRNLLNYGDLSFRDFMEVALYHPQFGYYTTDAQRVGKGGDYVTAPSLSPLFSFALARLVREFVSRGEGALCSIVDIGCGDGGLIRALAADASGLNARFFGVDRSLERIAEPSSGAVTFFNSVDQIPRDGLHLLFSNELFDAIPFARLVERPDGLHELWVAERDGVFDWVEYEAGPQYGHYFAERGIQLAPGQFADIALEWGAMYEDMARQIDAGLIVTCDYGFRQDKLFHPRARRFGTAAAYSGQRVSRDLLANAGEQDLTAHINFTDLEIAGRNQGAQTIYFEPVAKFLLSLGAHEHPLFRPLEEQGITDASAGVEFLEERENARRLILPDGIGEELKVQVQIKGMGDGEWSFQKKLY